MRGLVFLAALWAAPVLAVELVAYPNSLTESVTQDEVQDYRVIGSPLRIIRSRVQADQEWRVQGQRDVAVLAIQPGHLPAEVARHYRQAMAAASGKLLFTCEGRDCGQNNAWANDIYGTSRVLGRDRDQHYLLAGWVLPGGQRTLYQVYVVERGNREVVARVERLWLPTSQGILENAAPTVPLLVLRWQPEPNVVIEDGAALQHHLRQTPDQRWVAVVYHGNSAIPVAEARQQSARVVEQLRELVERAGVTPDRLRVVVPGPDLSPELRTYIGSRIEILPDQ